MHASQWMQFAFHASNATNLFFYMIKMGIYQKYVTYLEEFLSL